MDEVKSKVLSLITTYGSKLILAIVALIIGSIIVKLLNKAARKALDKTKLDDAVKHVLAGLIKILLYAILVIAVVQILGVPMSSVIAILASCGLAVGLAMQGALSNLVGGVTLLLLKPIRAEEYIKVGDFEGTVRSIGAFYTDLITPDNRHISIPNSTLTNTAIINVTREGKRRIDIPFAVSYDADMDRIKQVLADTAASNPAVLPDPAPQVLLNTMGESSLNYILRLWAKNDDYWNVYFDLTDRCKRALDAAGIRIPYPQMDVHMKQE